MRGIACGLGMLFSADGCRVIRGVPPPVVPALAIDARAKITLVDDSCALSYAGDAGAHIDCATMVLRCVCAASMLNTLVCAVVCLCACVPVRLAAMLVAATNYLTHAPGRRREAGVPLSLPSKGSGVQPRGDRDDSYEYGAPEPETDRYM